MKARWLMFLLAALVVVGCGSQKQSAAQAEQRAASMAASNQALATPSSAETPPSTSTQPDTTSDAASQGVAPAPLTTPSDPSANETSQTTDASSEATATAEPSPTTDSVDSGPWASYPWPPNDDGKACTAPHLNSAEGREVMVVLGDSHIRNASGSLREALRGNGFEPVFVCWGGKTTAWGIKQIQLMRERGILPRCLVINLGTNDVKNEGASAAQLESNLEALVGEAADIPHVMLVNIWANTALAPATMKNVAQTIDSYTSAAGTAGNVSVVKWAQQARSRPELVGDDGVHDSGDGEAVRTNLISQAVAEHCG